MVIFGPELHGTGGLGLGLWKAEAYCALYCG